MRDKDLNRQPRLRSVRETPPGWLRLVTCNGCSRQALLPAEALIRKHGELAPVEFALMSLRCSSCDHHGASLRMVRLCEPGCPRQRG